MRWMLWAAAAAALVLGGSAPTFAQMGGSRSDQLKPPHRAAKPAPRAKRYYYRSGYKTCGQYRYWKGGKCLDARTSPPKLK
ncbi:MAG TPA: hypothetical protein VH913_13570 [Hyphomicrobiaceae bacterium]|jgi:hypothetical protein